MADASFEQGLNEFQMWANSVDPNFGAQVSDIIARSYVSQLGENAAITPAVTTANKLSDFISSVGDTYLKSVTAYYTAKGKVADLKLLAKGSTATQLVNTAQGAISLPPSNLLLFGGLGALALILLMRNK